MQTNNENVKEAGYKEEQCRKLSMDSCRKEKLKLANDEEKLLKRKVNLQVAYLFVGLIFGFSAFRGVLNLQSSINIEGSIGAISGTTMYFTGIFWGLILTPYLLSVLGPKICLIISEFGYVVFILGNVYPVLPIILCTSILTGMAEATIWPSISLLCVHLAGSYANITQKSAEKYLSKIVGEFYSMVFLTASLSGLISFIVLHVMNHHHHGYHVDDSNTTDDATNINTDYCGSKDCQDPNVTQSNIDHYVPSKTTIYFLLSVYALMAIIAIVIHSKLLTMVPMSSHKTARRLSEVNGTKKVSQFNAIKKTGKQVTNPLQILLLPLTIYGGLKSGFMISEFTRAFVACVIGVENVGLLFIEHGIGGCIASYMAKKWTTRKQRNLAMLSILLLDGLMYTVMLVIEFNQSTIWICHILSMLQGVTLVILFTKSNLMCTIYFEKTQHESAFTIWNLSIIVGLMLQFGLSTYFCMDTKLYLHIAILIISSALYGLVDVIHYRNHHVASDEEEMKMNCDNQDEA